MMKKFSNRYIFIYITLLVVIIACGLGMANLWLQPYKTKNQENETKKQILQTVGYFDISEKKVAEIYEKVVKKIPLNASANSLFIYEAITSKNEISYVIPLTGKGLWGPIWGYIAVADDGNRVIGAVFAHKGETPGLGAQIASEEFAATFKGKLLFDENGNFLPIKVVKGSIIHSNIDPKHCVDAITGGTVTSKGVEEMLENSIKPYVPFLKKLATKSLE